MDSVKYHCREGLSDPGGHQCWPCSIFDWLACESMYFTQLLKIWVSAYSSSLHLFSCRVIIKHRKRLCGPLPILPVGAPFSRWFILFKPMSWNHSWICFPLKMPKQSLSFWMPLQTSSWWEVMSSVTPENLRLMGKKSGIILVTFLQDWASKTDLAFFGGGEVNYYKPVVSGMRKVVIIAWLYFNGM